MMNLMKLRVYKIGDLCSRMLADASKGKISYATLFFDEAVELVRELLKHDVHVISIDLTDEIIDGYTREYFISLDGEDMELNVEKAWHEKNEWNDAGYLYFEANTHYIDGDASSTILGKQGNPKCDTYELLFDTYDYDDVPSESDRDFTAHKDDNVKGTLKIDDVNSVLASFAEVYNNLSDQIDKLFGYTKDTDLHSYKHKYRHNG